MSADLVSIVEAVYDLEDPDENAWLRGIVARTRAAVGRSRFGVYGLTYDASDVDDCRFSGVVTEGVDDPRVTRVLEVDCAEAYRRNPRLVEAIFRRIGYAPSRELPLGDDLVRIHAKLHSVGVDQILGINGVNVDGRGAHIGILLRRPGRRPDDALARLSTHLAASHRLRRRLAGARPVERADAVLDPGGKVAHAEGDARTRSARSALAEAAVRLDRLRSRARRQDPERALRTWRALVDARWSLVDHFERDGRRYVLAQRNDPDVAPLELLSEREHQVVALAAIGHSNKMIAYELGIAVSTAAVLLSRAARRVGAGSRRALVEAFRRRRS